MYRTLSDCFAKMGRHDDTVWEPLIHYQFEKLQKFFRLIRDDLDAIKDLQYHMDSEDVMIVDVEVRDGACIDNIVNNIESKVDDSFDISFSLEGNLVNIVIKHSESR